MPRVSIQSAAANPTRVRAVFLDLVDRYGQTITTAGMYASLAVIYFWFGGMKFTAYEAEGLTGLVGNSPLLSWTYSLFSVRAFSGLLGVVEISIGALIAARLFNPLYSLIGGVLSAGLFVTTLSFMVTTPGVFLPELGFPAISVAPGQFLLKDIGLLALSSTDRHRLARCIPLGQCLNKDGGGACMAPPSPRYHDDSNPHFPKPAMTVGST